jgi:LPPG:FO 2-phospho-L-lactate transferase
MKIVALAGGVGGAKLADGLARHLSSRELTVIVNTGDDFEHLGLTICPDLDTVCYTLAGLANPVTGWGRLDETWNAINQLGKLGGPDWFRLGDRDIATHLERTRRLREGKTLTQITIEFCEAWEISHTILPMTDSVVRTVVKTNEGDLPFQEYFVRRRCEPVVKGFRFDGADSADPAPGVYEAIESAEAVVICPSNPWVSIDPILAISDIRMILTKKKVIAVSPIIAGKAIKGPAARMFSDLGIDPSALAVAEHYRDILSGFVLDTQDAHWVPALKHLDVKTLTVDTHMNHLTDRARLASDVLHFIGRN